MASAHDFAEIARSASEAKKTTLRDVDLKRYQNPSSNTCYALEYAFYLLPDIREKVVLDLGCGSGEELVPLCQRGARVIGIDISPDLIAIAYQRLRKYGVAAELRIASAYDMKLSDKSVDVVFCMSLLHHLQLDRVQPEIRRILKPNGLFILKEPIRFSWTLTQLRRLFPAQEEISEFEHPLNAKQVNALTAGFQVQSSRSFRTPLVPVLTRTIKEPHVQKLIRSCDAWALRHFPVLAHFATVRVMALRRPGSSTTVLAPPRRPAAVISIKSEVPCPRPAARSFCRRAIILLLLTLTLVSTIVARGIAKGEFHINVDESQHAASGLFYASLLRDAPIRHPIRYTYRYYAQYPALSGVIHWPPLFYAYEGLFFIVFGASVITARMTILLFSLMACIFWFRLVYDIQDDWTAGLSTAILALLPSVLLFEKAVMLEIPCLALSVAAPGYPQ
jgi:2-polyprenyl-3-methyl-5-hydroxy-6-metoxy-1,4-benzoquinol methylase